MLCLAQRSLLRRLWTWIEEAGEHTSQPGDPDHPGPRRPGCARWETCAQLLGWEDLLEEGMATHSIILALKILMDRGGWWATVHGVPKRWTQLSN